MKLYELPLSTHAQKLLMALYEKAIEFIPELVILLDGATPRLAELEERMSA